MPDTEMDEPDEDSWAISEMEMEYAGTPSMQEDWCWGDYGDTPTYHAILSPTIDEDDRIFEGSMADMSLGTEAALLRPVEASKAPLAGQQMVLAKQQTTKG